MTVGRGKLPGSEGWSGGAERCEHPLQEFSDVHVVAAVYRSAADCGQMKFVMPPIRSLSRP